ncbi:hypothetical protein [Serratia plymuthica]|uniref:Uncharacterized protein n=1 Tax=Serratia plymuthica TaxID=82996 RepID=A0A2X4UV97_SERPL|nr:hypothetical protein [Serratia plymuthica]QPS20245.1 hypothetical protein I6G64_22265 [Serratia plymuthica]QPS61859.1 hypothetical protein I6G52_17525 [Serratia plymuthica]RKS61044.1 hypothetical protein C8E17_0149 [Serratia plymuthica]CAI2478138.1 Uncharacterised protein [Serratia plymuthica]SQI42813.1 Uncharacterised protein [Serratia plymuthica]
MLRKRTLAASCCTALLMLSAYSAQALDLSYTAPEPSPTPAPVPQSALGPAAKTAKPPVVWSESEDKTGFRVEMECDHPGCSRPRAKPYSALSGPVKKTDRLRQSDPYSTNQDPDYSLNMGYQW